MTVALRLWPTDKDARQALVESAVVHENGVMWSWNPTASPADVMWHSEEEALALAKACLYLGVRVTDRVSIATWVNIVERIARLEGHLMGGTE